MRVHPPMCGGAGTSRDPLLAAVRRSLRIEHGFPVGPRRMPPPWGVPAIYSIEEVSSRAHRVTRVTTGTGHIRYTTDRDCGDR